MDYKELNQVLANLDQATQALEDLYMESEGEVTEQTEEMENQIYGLKQLLTQEGIDLLGGWLKAKEDKKKALKAEKDYISRQMAAIDETIDFIKEKINRVMVAAGQEKVKGDRGYSFTAYNSVKTEINKDMLKALYGEKVEEAIRSAHVPAYIGVTLTASATKAEALGIFEGDEEIFSTTKTPSVKFNKPRASKEA